MRKRRLSRLVDVARKVLGVPAQLGYPGDAADAGPAPVALHTRDPRQKLALNNVAGAGGVTDMVRYMCDRVVSQAQ